VTLFIRRLRGLDAARALAGLLWLDGAAAGRRAAAAAAAAAAAGGAEEEEEEDALREGELDALVVALAQAAADVAAERAAAGEEAPPGGGRLELWLLDAAKVGAEAAATAARLCPGLRVGLPRVPQSGCTRAMGERTHRRVQPRFVHARRWAELRR